MSMAIIGVTTAVASIGTGIYAANKSSKAAKEAASQQQAAQQAALDEQKSQFEKLQETLRPYVEAGKVDLTQPYIQAGPGALQAMQGLAGLRGAAEQQAAINQIKQGAQYQELARQGEEAILQNAAATGGLRGGNVQAALSQFRPALLNQLIESQYGKLAGLTSLGSTSAENLLRLGQASAAGVGAAGQQSAQAIGNLMTAQGAAQAAGTIGAANAQAQGLGAISGGLQQGVGNYMMFQALNKPTMTSGIGTGGFYGSQAAAQAAYGPGFDISFSQAAGPGGAAGWYGTPSA